jgi:predicted HTH transcriptional regulator
VDADAYLANVRERFPNALELQCIPKAPELWRLEHYEQFLEARRQILADGLNGFLEGITSSRETELPVSLSELIAEGESDELEFKSSLRWDLRNEAVSAVVEQMVVKTVAAFANSQGGTLLIGVRDDGAILGLDHDYASLRDGNRDQFELHLRQLLGAQLGKAFVAGKVQVRFHELEGKDLCQVEVLRASEPVIVTVNDKSGAKVEKFYARSGNSSPEIPLSEIPAYVRDRFHK